MIRRLQIPAPGILRAVGAALARLCGTGHRSTSGLFMSSLSSPCFQAASQEAIGLKQSSASRRTPIYFVRHEVVPSLLSTSPTEEIARAASDVDVAVDLIPTDFAECGLHPLVCETVPLALTTGAEMRCLEDNGSTLLSAVVGYGIDHIDAIDTNGSSVITEIGRLCRFLYIFRHEQREEAIVLFRSFRRTFGIDDDVTLVIYGPGRELELEAMLGEAGLRSPGSPDTLTITDPLPPGDEVGLFHSCDVVVSLRHDSAFNLEVAAAIWLSKPVIVTAIGGHMDYCNGANARLVDFVFTTRPPDRHRTSVVKVEPCPASLERRLECAYRGSHGGTAAADPDPIAREALRGSLTWKSVGTKLVALASVAPEPARAQANDPRIGWVTTWNVKCGIASHVRNLLDGAAGRNHIVLAPRQPHLIRPDDANCVRCWDLGKHANGLEAILDQAKKRSLDILVIHFNYGFFDHAELSQLIHRAADSELIVFIDLHSTTDPPGDRPNLRIRELASALRRCHRVLAHSVADMNRLKAIGISENLLLFPLGVVTNRCKTPRVTKEESCPTIASFGYSFPNKGLEELVLAAWLLKQNGRRIDLRMFNATHPDPTSAQTVLKVRELIRQLSLGSEVRLDDRYIDDAQCLDFLSQADLIVNPYQQTGESASASVRYALATGRPVLVTPLTIFDDLGDAVFRTPGTRPEQIAQGISDTLDHLLSQSPVAVRVRDAADAWLTGHDVSVQARKLESIAKSILQNCKVSNAGRRS